MSGTYRSFPHPNPLHFRCPVCGTRADAPVVLVLIPGTENDGLAEAVQVHEVCENLRQGMRLLPEVEQESLPEEGS